MSSSIDTMTIPVEQPPSGGHPRGLYVLFMAEMWERFCYYGMRVLLTLYLIRSLMKGDNEAFAIYGAYTALVYAAPVLGGMIADKILGYRIAVILGGILMAIGEFMILGGTDHWLYIGMGTIIVGNGYFKANISSIVGKLYKDGDPRRDSGFTIFYIGINIGALLATTVCAEVGEKFGFEYGFALAGLGMLAGIGFFVGGQNTFRQVAEAPDPVKLNAPYLGPITLKWTTIIASLVIIPILYFLIMNASVVGYLLYVALAYVLWSLLSRGVKEGKVLLQRMLVFIILMVFNVVFWACFEQAGTSLTLFADRNVDRDVFGWEMGAATTQFFNPFFIIVMGSVFSMLWVYLNRIGKNPNIPMKFGIGIILLGLGYLVVKIAPVNELYLVPLWTLILLYFLHTVGELFISPIGLSMVTKLVPKDMTGTAMGAWFLSFAFSNYAAALLAKLTGAEEGSDPAALDTAETLATYTEVYGTMGMVTVGIGIFLLLISGPLNRMMHGVR
ncbi:MAG: oligopeptide:H+ symporter [Flavobacteriales bacterium]|nr:oligopeptide:H+ symporter [Flavobacteriales bacterium]